MGILIYINLIYCQNLRYTNIYKEVINLNFRYLIQNFSAKKIIDYYSAHHFDDSKPIELNVRQTQEVYIRKSIHEENALFFQLLYYKYELTSDTNGFEQIRTDYKQGDIDYIEDYQTVFDDMLIYINFDKVFNIENVIRKEHYTAIAKSIFKNGIILNLKNDVRLKFKPFIKSGSMGRNFTISFIRDDLKDPMLERMTLGIIHKDFTYSISKLLAYEGLYMSTGIRIDSINLNKDSVVIVKDTEWQDVTEKYTSFISKSLVRDKIMEMLITDDIDKSFSNLEFLTDCSKYFCNKNTCKSSEKHVSQLREIEDTYRDLRELYIMQAEMLAISGMSVYEQFDEDVKEIIEELIQKFYKVLHMDHINDMSEYVLVENVRIPSKTNMFDGEGFIDKSLLNAINKVHLNRKKEPYHNSVQVRMPFTKGVLHSLDINKWFKQVKVSYIVDAFGIRRETSKIKAMISVSMFKCFNWLNRYVEEKLESQEKTDPMVYYFEKFKEFNHGFYITNTDSVKSATRNTILNYQLLHTPALTRTDFFSLLLKGNDEYIKLCTDTETQLNYFNKDFNAALSKESIKYQFNTQEHTILKDILKVNKYFIHDKVFQNRIAKYSNTLLKNMKLGRILIEGTTKYLSGDLLYMLLNITGDVGYQYRGLGSLFYAPGENYNISKSYSILRNPHITSKELIQAKPLDISLNSVMEEYFGHLHGVVMINAFTNQMLAMQTADTDGDIVRIIENEVYNDAVKKAIDMNNKRILFFPDLVAKQEKISHNSFFNANKLSFSARIGTMSNHAFSHSVKAYNENDPNEDKKRFQMLKAEKMSFLIASEIDSAKTGKAPNYMNKKFRDNFLEFKYSVENTWAKEKEIKPYTIAPNMFYLPQNAKKTHKEMKVLKRKNDDPFLKKHRFNFEETHDWEKHLHSSLRNELELHIIAYTDWMSHISFITTSEDFRDSKILLTVKYIVQLQYEDSRKEAMINEIISKFINIDISLITSALNKTISEQWQLSLASERSSFCNNILPGILSYDEIKLLSNFDMSGHKMLYLLLIEAKQQIDNKFYRSLNSHDSVTRYMAIINNILDHNNLDGKEITKSIFDDIISGKDRLSDITNAYFTSSEFDKSIDYEVTTSTFKKLNNVINKYRKNIESIKRTDLDIISGHYSVLVGFVFDYKGKTLPASVYRKSIYDYYCKEIENLFKKYGVDINEQIKYIYSLRKHDNSLRFMYFVGREYLLESVMDYRGEGEQNAK